MSRDGLDLGEPEPGKWTTGWNRQQATVVQPNGRRVTGYIVNWYAPGECELDSGARGVLLETWLRRQEQSS